MAGKTNQSSTAFAQKKLVGKAHTSNLKLDFEEPIASSVQMSAGDIFGEAVPESPEQTLYLMQSASNGGPATVEWVQFELEALTGSDYRSDHPDAARGDDPADDDNESTAQYHAYKFKLPSDYETSSSNPNKGTGFFRNNQILHQTIGDLQIVPPFYSADQINPFDIQLFRGSGGAIGSQIGAGDDIDWQVDTYSGILFVQDPNEALTTPAFAKAFLYTGKMLSEVVSDAASSGGGGGSGSGDDAAEYILTSATGSLPNSKVIEAGAGITIVTGSNTVTISSSTAAINGREKTTYFVTASHFANNALDIIGPDFSAVNYDTNKIDINVNGQLLHTGSSSQVASGERDYYLSNTGSIVFGFNLEADDVVDAIISVVGGDSGGGVGEIAASYLVLSNTGSLSNERAFVAGTGLTADDSGANGNYTLSIDDSIVATLTASAIFSNGISGSLTQLADGTSYIIGGGNVTVSSASNGAITISSFIPERNKEIYEVNNTLASGSAFTTTNSNFGNAGFKTNLIDVYLNGQLLMSGTDSQVGAGSVDYFVSSYNEVKFGFDLKSEDVINVMITPTGSSGGSGGSGGSGTEYTAGTGLVLNGTEFSIDDSVVTTLTSSATFTNGLSGSLTQLSDGSSYLIAGSNITITSASNGSVTIASTGGGTSYTAGTGIILDGTEFSIDDSIVTTLTSSAQFSNGLSGSLTQLTDGTSYLIAGSNVSISSASNGAITITATDTNTTYAAGDGLSLVGTEFSIASSIAGDGLTESSGVLSVVNGTNGGLFVDTNSVSLNLANLAEAVVDVASDSIAIIDADGFTTRRETIADFVDATAGTGINAASGVLSINDSVVATISGSQFSGNVGITGSLGVESTTIFNGGIHENFETKSAATGVVTHDCSTGHIFFHSGSTSNFTANFTNLNLSTSYATNLTLLVTQSATAYIPSAVQIEGSSQTLMWQGGSAPSGTANGQDVVSFSILNNSGSYVVLGQLVGFG